MQSGSLLSRLPPGQTAIGSRTIPFFDVARNRPIITEVFYPTHEPSNNKIHLSANIWQRYPEARNAPLIKNHRYPLVVFSHGNAGSRIETVWLIYKLVRKAYLVASVEHFGNTWDHDEIEESWKRWNRAQDVSFAIRGLLKHPDFSENLDEDRIGFSGFSLGGLTGIWLAGAKALIIEQALQDDPETLQKMDLVLAKQSYQDPLIKAEFLMAPAYGLAFDPASLAKVSIPIYIVIGRKDKIVPPQEAQYLRDSIPNCTLNILEGLAGHFVFLNKPTTLGKILLPKSIVLDHLLNNTAKIHASIAQKAASFFDQHLKI